MTATEDAINAVTARMAAGDAPELSAIHERVAKGVAWLTEHDPKGIYHLWFESGISPHLRTAERTDEVMAPYAEYHRNRALFDDLWQRMERLELIETRKAQKEVVA